MNTLLNNTNWSLEKETENASSPDQELRLTPFNSIHKTRCDLNYFASIVIPALLNKCYDNIVSQALRYDVYMYISPKRLDILVVLACDFMKMSLSPFDLFLLSTEGETRLFCYI